MACALLGLVGAKLRTPGANQKNEVGVGNVSVDVSGVPRSFCHVFKVLDT